MANLFVYPFRINPDGSVAKIPEGEEYYAYELANLIQTTPGERSLVPDYGVTDPVFNSLNIVELLGKIEMFGPPVSITDNDVIVSWPQEGRMNLSINYSVSDANDDDAVVNSQSNNTDDYYDNDDTEPNVNDYFGFNLRTDV